MTRGMRSAHHFSRDASRGLALVRTRGVAGLRETRTWNAHGGPICRVAGASAQCDMLKFNTHNSARLAMCSTCHGCARIAAWLKCFEIVLTCVTPIVTKEVRVFPPLPVATRLQSAHPLRSACWVSGVLSWLSSPDPGLVAVSCQCSDSSYEPLLVDQPRSHDVPAKGVGWAVLLGVGALSLCAGCLGATALFIPCGFVAWGVRHVQSYPGLTRVPLYDAAEGAVIRYPRPHSLPSL